MSWLKPNFQSWLSLGISGLLLGCNRPVESPKPQPTTTAATSPSTEPLSTPSVARADFLAIVREHYPQCPATQPLDLPLALSDAAQIQLDERVYLDPRGDLWITRPDAPPLPEVLQNAAQSQVHVIKESVAYVHWQMVGGITAPVIVVGVGAKQPDTWETVSLDAHGKTVERRALGDSGRGYEWARAFSFNDDIVVPTKTGASVFHAIESGPWVEDSGPNLVGALTKSVRGSVQIAVDYQGLFAWFVVDGDQPAMAWPVARYIDGRWSTLGPDARWPAGMQHLVPLADGSVLQISAGDAVGTVKLGLTGYEPARVDIKLISGLLRNLSSDEQEKRDAAYSQLQTYGSGIWDLLERALPRMRGEGRLRVETLLKNKLQPRLGAMQPLGDRLKIVARGSDGSVLCFCESGVSMPAVDQPDETVVPHAWLSIRPGQAVQLLSGPAWERVDPVHYRFYSVNGNWVVSDEARGPREFVGTIELRPLLPKELRRFWQVIGVDRQGRWLFREPVAVGVSPGKSPTLILDPTLPSLTPRLPVWNLNFPGGTVGWTQQGFPAFRDASKREWVVGETGFRVLNGKQEKLISEEAGQVTETDTRPPLNIATLPTSRAAMMPSESLFIDSAGRKFFGGLNDLRIVSPGGTSTIWPLPENAIGTATVHLVSDDLGRLYLFNEPGRVIRLKPTPSTDPYTVDAIFSRNIPNTDSFSRIWLDPCNRIVIAYDRTRLAILFPAGHVNRDIADKMPAELDEEREK